jgi:hypothetical protein
MTGDGGRLTTFRELFLAARNLAGFAVLGTVLIIILLPRAPVPLKLAAVAGATIVWANRTSKSASLRELARYVAGFVAFAALRNLADDAAALIGIPVRYDYVINWERGLFGWLPHGLPTLAVQGAFLAPGKWGALDYGTVVVYMSYFVFPPALVAALWLWWPQYLRRYVTATLALFTVAGVINFIFPTAPPWYAAMHGRLPGVVQLGRAIVGEISSPAYRYGSGLSGNAVAAMPSVHIGVVMLLACAFWRTPLRWLCLSYLSIMSFAVVYGGDHYVVDVLAGDGLAMILWHGARQRGQVPAA